MNPQPVQVEIRDTMPNDTLYITRDIDGTVVIMLREVSAELLSILVPELGMLVVDEIERSEQ